MLNSCRSGNFAQNLVNVARIYLECTTPDGEKAGNNRNIPLSPLFLPSSLISYKFYLLLRIERGKPIFPRFSQIKIFVLNAIEKCGNKKMLRDSYRILHIYFNESV